MTGDGKMRRWKPPSSERERNRTRHRIALLALVPILFLATQARAQEFELRAADLRVVGDASWTGGGWGGYHPIRLEMTNFGPGRDLELRFEPHDTGEGVPTVRRRVRIEQNATARLTLSVPLVGGNSGRFRILIAGAEVEGLRRDLSLMPRDGGGVPIPSLLAISPEGVDFGGYQHAVLAASQEWGTGAVPSSHVLGGPAIGETRYATVSPALLPASWVDYSAVDLIAIRLDTLADLRSDERTALIDWAAAGGRLVVHRVGPAPADSEELDRLIDGSKGEGWEPADPVDRRLLEMVFALGGGTPNEGDPTPLPVPLPFPTGGPLDSLQEQFGQLMRSGGEPRQFGVTGHRWPASPAAFAVRRIGFGQVASVSEDVFTGSGADWAWLLRTLHGPAAAWPVRTGISSGVGDIEFINLPIRGVRGVPVFAFLSLITLFAFAIGPVNYFLLWRKKRLARLVLTVPAVAAATSVLLFGYAAVAHGFGSKGRVRSVTLIDPETNAATSLSRVAVFSGLAPSQGLVFSNRTAVYPLLPYGEEFSDGEVDWSEAQGLAAGWLKTRTRTQFVTLARRDERGRLTVTPVAGGLKVVNGFSVPFQHLVVTGADGTPYYAARVAAGGEAAARPLSDENWTAIRELALDRRPEPPDGVEAEEIKAGLAGRPWRWGPQSWAPQFRFGLLERHLDQLTGQPPEARGEAGAVETSVDIESPVRIDSAVRQDVFDPLAGPNGFLAVVDGNPGIELGGLEVDERDSLHVLMGRW